MKKFAAFVTVFALLVVAAPSLAATNPFMDVPMNHWAYDAIGQLAAKGILSGYPDGLYKGNRSMTRYEAASAIARAVAYVDMTKASKQDVEMLKKLVIEFKDELDALGVRVDELEKDMAIFKSRLGGWKISGRLRMDIDYHSLDIDSQDAADIGLDMADYDDSMGEAKVADARVLIERWFGENEEMYFQMRLRAHDSATIGTDDRTTTFDRFNVSMPFFWDSRLTAGRAYHDWSRRFFFASSGPARYEVPSWFSDNTYTQLMWEKNFALGSFGMSIGHTGTANDLSPDAGSYRLDPTTGLRTWNPNGDFEAWNIFLNFQGQFNEQFGFHLGGQILVADDWDDRDDVNPYGTEGPWDNIITGFVGLDFFFMEGLAFRGTAYIQGASVEDDYWDYEVTNNYNEFAKPDGGTAFQIALTVDQSVLKFTSLWLQYDYIPQGFYIHNSLHSALFFFDGDELDSMGFKGMHVAFDDFSIIRAGATQQWNEKWSTWLYYAKIDLDEFDYDFNNYAAGIEYAYNANVFFGLNYMYIGGGDSPIDQSRVRFTTQVVF